jgi:UDP-N-acetylglucosamine 1-carboxyvinyltransferase
LIPEVVILGIHSKGNMKIYSIMYETQLLFVEQLLRMKAKLDLVNSHEVISFGTSSLIGVTLEAPGILRCAYALILAGLATKGETIIKNADIIERGYPDLVQRLRSLGVDIKKIK